MRDNIGRVLERGQNLSDLNVRAEQLDQSSENFRTQADSIRRRAWWRDMRVKLGMGGVALLVLIIIIIIASR